MLEKALRIYRVEGFFWGAFLTAKKIYFLMVGFLISRVVSAPGLKVNSWPGFRGVRFFSFGKDIFINGNCWFECINSYRGAAYSPILKIGSRTSFSERVHISVANKVSIGEGVLFGSNIYVSDNGHGAYRGAESSSPEVPPALRPLNVTGEVIIGNNVWIGDNCVLLAPVRVGDGSIIGANSVVKGDIPAGEIWAGAPARCIKYFDHESKQWIPRK